MNNDYSRSLYNLYKEGQTFCNTYKKTIDYLVEDESGLEPPAQIRTFSSGAISLPASYLRTNIRTLDTDKALRDAYTHLQEFKENWNKKVFQVLDQLPHISFRMQFEEPGNGTNLPTFNYPFISLTEDVEEVVECFCDLEDRVDTLYSIISDYEDLTSRAVIQTNNLNSPIRQEPEAVYRLTYDAMSGNLYLNDTEIYHCNLDSKLEQAIISALEHPRQSVEVQGDLASAIGNIKIPQELRRLLFRTGKGSFMINPIITADDLVKRKLNQDVIDAKLQKPSK